MSSLAPVIVFYAGTKFGPAWLAVLLGFLASTVVFYLTRKHRLIGLLTAFSFGVVALSSIYGIIWNSEKAYLASGPIRDFLFVPLYFGSIVVGKPLIGGIARELNPAIAGRLPHDASIFTKLTIAWAAYDLIQGAYRVVMLQAFSTGEYLVWSRIFAMPVSGVLLAITAWTIYQAAKRDADAKGEKLPAFSWEQAPSSPVLDALD